MSNCYASYYTKLPYYTQEQKDWLEKQLATCEDVQAALESDTNYDWDPEAEDIDEWNFGEHEWEPYTGPSVNGEERVLGYLVLHDCEAADADVAFLALVYNEKFGCLNEKGWTMSVAFTADREGEDAFGGCSYTIYKNQTFYVSTYDYEQFCEEQDEIDGIITAWDSFLEAA